MLRVCHVIHSLQEGGAEDVLIDLARASPAHGMEISVVSLLPVDDRRVAAELRASAVEVASVGVRSRWDPRALRRGLDAIRACAPDVVHTHLKHADVVGAFAARRLGVPMVSTLHLIEQPGGPVARLKRTVAANARNRVAAVTIAVSDAQREWYLEAFRADPDRVVTVRNGVRDTPPLAAAARESRRRALGVGPGGVLAAMIAMMRPGKGHHDLLAAAEALGADSGVTFVLAGDGELRAELEARARALPVVFTGFCDDVPGLLAAADFVVHPTHADALPTALIRALAAGRAVVASNVGGVPEIVVPGAGMLVPPGDVTALVGAIRLLTTDAAERERLGRGARQHYEAEFAPERWLERLHDVYLRARARAKSSTGTRGASRP